MIDHLIAAPDRATMAAMLAPLGLASVAQDGSTSFAADVCLNVGGPNDESLRVILADAVWDKSDPNPRNWTITTPEVLAQGFFVIVAKDALDPALRDLPGNACRLITDRDAAVRGESFIRYTAPDMDPQVLTTARVEPTFAGSRYPLGAAP